MNTIDFLRSYKFKTIAIFDVVASIIGLYIIAYIGILGNIIKSHSLLFAVIGTFPIGELFHYIFNVQTPVLKYITSL
jgi:hypothetical protein